MRVATDFVCQEWSQITQISMQKSIWKAGFTPRTIDYGDISTEEIYNEISRRRGKIIENKLCIETTFEYFFYCRW